MLDPTTVDPMPEQDPFWHRRKALSHIYTYARARRVSPWATLGGTMVRAIAVTPHTVVLPALIGARMSLNMLVAAVGPSGAGKDAAEGASRDGILLGDDDIPLVPIGSGEGIGRTYRPQGTKPDDPNTVDAAVFTASEIDTWAALAVRSGSTLTAEMRKLYTGATLGFANAGKDTRNVVKAHSYRACGIFGVQPLRSGPLIAAADGGLPQRIGWFPATDPDAPDDPPEAPEPMTIATPDWQTADWISYSGEQMVLSVPARARHEIDAHRLAVLRGDPDIDPLDGHALLTRLKVAAALMVLDGQTTISEEDWELAGVVMAVSAATRAMCQRALTEHSRRTNEAKAHATADREEIIAERLSDQAQRRVVKAICGKLRRIGRATRSELRVGCTAAIRGEFDAVFEMLLDKQIITACGSDGKRPPPEYEFGPEYQGGLS